MAIDLYVRPRARQDVVDHALYIANDNPSAAERFVTSVQASCELLIENSMMGMEYESACSSLASIRVWPVSGFKKYLIFYRADGSYLEIVRVLHTSRDIPAILQSDDQSMDRD